MTTVRGGAFRKWFVPGPGAGKEARCGVPRSANGESASGTTLNQYGQLVRVIGIAEVGLPAAGLAKRIRGGLSGEFELGKPADHPTATAGRHWQRAGAHHEWPRVTFRRLRGLRRPGYLVWHRPARALHGDGMADRVRPSEAGRHGEPVAPRGGVQPSDPGAVGSGRVDYLSCDRRAEAGVDCGGHADRHRAAGFADVRPLDP